MTVLKPEKLSDLVEHLAFCEPERGRTISIVSRSTESKAVSPLLEAIADQKHGKLVVRGLFLKAPKLSIPITHSIEFRRLAISNAGNVFEQIVFGDEVLWTGSKLKNWRAVGFERGVSRALGADHNMRNLANSGFRALWAVCPEIKPVAGGMDFVSAPDAAHA